MALMGWREPNQVKWVGTRPAHRGTQIGKSASAVNATAIVYTVTAGKTLYLCTASLMTETATVSAGIFSIRDGADVSWLHLTMGRANTAGYFIAPCVTFWPPLEVPAGYDIVVFSSAALAAWTGSIFGWEE